MINQIFTLHADKGRFGQLIRFSVSKVLVISRTFLVYEPVTSATPLLDTLIAI